MNVYVKEYPYDIYVYGHPSVSSAVCRDIQRLGLGCTELGDSPDALASHTFAGAGKVVVALRSEDAYGKIRAQLVSQNSVLEPMIMRDIEFFSELLTYAQVEEAPQCAQPEPTVAVGLNIDFVLGGAETWATQLFFALKRELVPQGVSVKMFEPRQKGPYTYVGHDFYGVAGEDVVQFGMFDGFLDYTLATLDYIIHHPPKLFFDNGSMQMMAAFYLAKRYLGLKTRIISVVHGNFSIFLGRVTRCQAAIDQFVGVSDTIVESLRARLPHREKDISVYLQLPPGHLESLDKKEGNTLRIAYAARLESGNKRSLWLLEVMDALTAAGVNFELSIAGDGECYEPLREHIEQQALGNRVHLLGKLPHDEMDAFYTDKHVFINFSVNEGGPLTLFESLSHGLVPVVTDTGCARRFIREEENGFLIDSPESTVSVLKKLASDLDTCRALEKAAIQTYLSQCTEMGSEMKEWLADSGIAGESTEVPLADS